MVLPGKESVLIARCIHFHNGTTGDAFFRPSPNAWLSRPCNAFKSSSDGAAEPIPFNQGLEGVASPNFKMEETYNVHNDLRVYAVCSVSGTTA